MSYDFRSRSISNTQKHSSCDIHDLRPLRSGDVVLLKQCFRQRRDPQFRPGSWQGYSILKHCPEFLVNYLKRPEDGVRAFIIAALFHSSSHPNNMLCRMGDDSFALIDPDSSTIVHFPSIAKVLAYLEQPAVTH